MGVTKQPKSRALAKEETRDALVAAGIALFGEEGLDGPSLDAICERAGYTRGAFYVHFADRDDFLIAVMQRAGAVFLDAVIAGARGTGGLAVTVRRFVASMASGDYPLTRKRGVRPHQLLEACARSPVIRKQYVSLITVSLERVAAVVRADQQSKILREDVDGDHVATLLLAAVIGAQTMLELGIPLDIEHISESILTLLEAPSKKLVRARKT
ncbi:MAG: TetR/AcrR family transcriptional regulator [Polyangiaceae bacterium]